MKELKYTPGPWFITGDMTLYVESRVGGGLIQEVAACGPTGADGGYGPQQQANARLIAAAPDMLQALQAFVENSSVHVNAPNECEAAENAIAKATGDAE